MWLGRAFRLYARVMGLPFIKMNGLGNDFVIVAGAFAPSAREVRLVADRAHGVGCDQVIAMGPAKDADVALRIWNADGGEVERCGNAERCVAWLTMRSSGRDEVMMRAGPRRLRASMASDGGVTVDMGVPGLGWRDIPLAWEMDTREIQLRIDETLKAPGCVSMGNPHVVFFVADAEAIDIAAVGPTVEHHWLFPERVNVGFASVIDETHLRLRVWERGTGLTKACGTGACAAVVAAHRKGLVGREVTVVLDGGGLHIAWREADGHVLMTGPVAVEFTGRLQDMEVRA